MRYAKVDVIFHRLLLELKFHSLLFYNPYFGIDE